MKTALIICRNAEAVGVVSESLGSNALVDHESTSEQGLERYRAHRYDYSFWDLELLLGDSENAAGQIPHKLDLFHNIFAGSEVIILCSRKAVAHAVELVKAGAAGYLTYPIGVSEVDLLLTDLAKRKQEQLELAYLREQFWKDDPEELSKTDNEATKELLNQARSVAVTTATVLLTGESGTGKGVLARLIQRHSSRSNKPFVEVHCGAMPDTLLESEFFGHEKGAFTGADRRKLGRFELAEQGTIFLDEVGTISSALQVKLLHVLQDKTFYRVGGEHPIEADVRIIAASNANLKGMVEDGVFREDLYYRLNIFPLRVPPLRERQEDIPHLMRTILRKLDSSHLKGIHDVHPLVLEAFQRYPWPGNIRELENVLERAYILEAEDLLMPTSFSAELFAFHPIIQAEAPAGEPSLMEARRRGTAILEEEYLTRLLEKYKGRIKDSAAIAGVSTRQLYKLVKKYVIRFEAFREKK